jgi:hypothetical protein
MTRDELLAIPSGRVLEKYDPKVRVRIMKPRKFKLCDICCNTIENEKMIRTEKGIVILDVTCVDCYLGNK